MSKRVKDFIKWGHIILFTWLASHHIIYLLSKNFVGIDGLYMHYTATAYAAQVAAALMVALVLCWRLSRALNGFGKTSVWRSVLATPAAGLTIGVIFLSLGVARNRSLWLYKILFENDTYGYNTPMAAVNSVVMVFILWFIMWVLAKNNTGGYKRSHMLWVIGPSALAGLVTYILYQP